MSDKPLLVTINYGADGQTIKQQKFRLNLSEIKVSSHFLVSRHWAQKKMYPQKIHRKFIL
jgi:hypothetical protein